MRKLFTGYRLTIALSSMIFSLGILYVCLNNVADNLEAANISLARQTAKFKTSEIENKSAALEKTMEALNPPYMNRAEAKRFLEETAEHIKGLYGGKYTGTIKDENGCLSIGMEFTVSPSSPSDIIAITDYLSASIAPIYKINEVIFSSLPNEKKASFDITLTQPYTGGEYVF